MANAEVAEDAEHPHAREHTDVAAPEDLAEGGGANALETAQEPPDASEGEPSAAPDAASRHQTKPLNHTTTPALKRSTRILLAFALPVAGIILLTPIVVAGVVVVAAAITDVVAALTVARLLLQGHLLQAGQAMNIILAASRLGFLALGYLGLFTALIALADGLMGRGRGRLFIIPGVILTGVALVLFATSVYIATPLLATLHLPHRTLAALALVFAVNAVAIATFLADTRNTRRRRKMVSKARQPAKQTQPPT